MSLRRAEQEGEISSASKRPQAPNTTLRFMNTPSIDTHFNALQHNEHPMRYIYVKPWLAQMKRGREMKKGLRTCVSWFIPVHDGIQKGWGTLEETFHIHSNDLRLE